ncbi:phage tail assembly chaperone [Pseudomonas mucidolens]|uniref:Phage tail assembly chaperone protein n=1 Tax=Pseudomonas mucidolens TaxID=46679 RepID=A0A1H2M4M6_9PSED|nr:phage tail assembly chaperone [Pseudomonas mucidolens]SDU87955.1 Phage tail assembly chaperone protein [Pseudomonas mucidolens]
MWARIENGTAVELTDIDPTDRFHPELVWQACPVETQPGWTVVEGALTPPPEDTSDQQAGAERQWRDLELAGTEWLVLRHRDEQDLELTPTLAPELFTELLSYRQALREWPQTTTFPDAEFRPVAPPWIAEQTQ